jgi:hydrogenase maturation protein HypF
VELKHLKIKLNGAVQGVGFRPFVYRIATENNLKGYIINSTDGVVIEVEGTEEDINRFLIQLNKNKPPLAHIFSQEIEELPLANFKTFEIKHSKEKGKKDVFILPDIATCDECLKELFNPNDRRYRYPFINCTNCGVRFSIIEKLPYDRKNTTMKKFKMCSDCEAEYKDPNNRRFHAEPNACPKCGPYISLYDNKKVYIADREEALKKTISLIKDGKIIAIKGVGGFHLVCDATNTETLKILRERKKRGEKPFALMFKDIDMIKKYANITSFEEAIIESPEKPIVIVEKKNDTNLSDEVAPYLNRIGVFLPYSPLHYLIMEELDFPIVMTSANLSDEPIVKDNEEAFEKLSYFADYLLIHNRDIKNRVDDSVVRIINKNISFIRRSRGYAPLPIEAPFELEKNILAVGGHQKNTVALGLKNKIIPSKHIGDLETLSSQLAFEETIDTFLKLYDFKPEIVISDLHPRYYSTSFAKKISKKFGIKHIQIQHHFSHALSLMAEYKLKEDLFSVVWDGTGYGEDGNLWGGEFLIVNYESYKRIAHLDYFKLIGGEKAVKEPRRVALSMLFSIYGKDLPHVETLKGIKDKEIELLYNVWEKGINSPLTSSIGRVFDGVASILGIRQKLSYEGQSGMIMENFYRWDVKDFYQIDIENNVINWKSFLIDLIEDKSSLDIKISRFFNTLAHLVLKLYLEFGNGKKLGLTGGVFQNKFLTEKIIELAKEKSIEILIHKMVPPNDGGISLGQAVYKGF